MKNCNICGEPFYGNDCPQCKTVIGLDYKPAEPKLGIFVGVSPEAEERAVAFLEEQSGHGRFPVAGPLWQVGRDANNDMIIAGDGSISRFHFLITSEGGYYFIADSGSRNGTYLNGSPVNGRTALSDGDSIKVGRLCFKFVIAGRNPEKVEADYQVFLRLLQERVNAGEPAPKLAETFDSIMPAELRKQLEERIACLKQPDDRVRGDKDKDETDAG